MIFNSPTRCGLSLLNYVPPVPSCRTCLHFYVPYVHSFFYVPYMPSFFTYVPSFFYVSYVPSFFTCLTRLLFYVSYVSSFFTCLYFIYVYADKTHTNELTYDCSLFSFAIIEINHLSMFIKCFHFCKTRVIFCMTFFLF